jgi:excisionase family DNA binding protein
MCKDKGDCHTGNSFLTIRQVADELGISERSVWRLIECGDLQVHKFGCSTRIRRSDLDAYIKRSRRQPPRNLDDDEGGEK